MTATRTLPATDRAAVISLGAGVQSTTLALMAARGELPMPVAGIFADTGWEPAAVYRHLEWLIGVLPFPVYTVSAGNLRDDAIAKATTGKRFASVPWFTLQANGQRGMGRRQCTQEYKLRPIQREVRARFGSCELWIGISTDEAHRMKPSRVRYIANRWPLIERRISRSDCLAWMARHGYPTPPKSSCIGCPFHSDHEWRALTSDEYAQAIEVDEAIRHQPGIRGAQYMHRSCAPLAEVDLSTAEERGQIGLWGEECEGLCGV